MDEHHFPKYPKIKNIYVRDWGTGKITEPYKYATPEFEYLAECPWEFTEKVDGCLHYSSKIITDIGLIPVGRIVDKKLPLKILSYNIDKQVAEFKQIVHYHREERLRPFIVVTVKSRNKGNKPKHIVCTDNHKFFIKGTWVEAKKLKKGSIVSHLTTGLSYGVKYKLPPQYKEYPCVLEGTSFEVKQTLMDTEVISVSGSLPIKARRQQKYQYDLTVEGNSNYFTNSILVHNTNIRVHYRGPGVSSIDIRGKTDKAEVPVHLQEAINETINIQALQDAFGNMPAMLCGEGYGYKIQKGGHYFSDSTRAGFILFDIFCGGNWLPHTTIRDLAHQFNICTVPLILEGTLEQGLEAVKGGIKSRLSVEEGRFAEGIVGVPVPRLRDRRGRSIQVKIKHEDFYKEVE